MEGKYTRERKMAIEKGDEIIISKHIFLFPFTFDLKRGKEICDSQFSERTDLGKIAQLLGDNWVKDCFKKEIWDFTDYNYHDEKVKATYQDNLNFIYSYNTYFYENVRKAVNSKNGKNDVVYNYKFKTHKSDTFSIKVKTSFEEQEDICKDSEHIFELKVEKIGLKLYETGIGILSYNLNNCNKDTTSDDILMINNWGRRVYPQFLPLFEVKTKMLPDLLTMNLQGGNLLISENFQRKYNSESLYISKTVMELLGGKFTYDCESCKKGQVFIKPVIDDRMYNICLYMNDEISEHLKSKKDGEYSWQEDEFWSKYILGDGKESRCQSDVMLRKFNKNSTYLRWINQGTLYGVTRYSFVALSALRGNYNEVLLNHFSYLYYDMACLVLAQRASILRFSEEASRLAVIDDTNNSIFKNTHEIALVRIKDLQLKYIHFINRLYFRDVTAQDQGTELYELMVNSMQIERDISRLDSEIDELHRYALLTSEDNTNNMLTILTIVSTVIAAIGLTTSFFGMNNINGNLPQITDYNNFKVWSITYILLPVILMLSFVGAFYTVLSKWRKKFLFFSLWIFLFLMFIILKVFVEQ